MLGWFSAAMARASRSNRSVNCCAETLIATSRPSRVSRARYTSPMPPAPMSARISYGPSLVPAGRDMSPVAEVHQPAQAEDGEQKIGEAVERVMQPLAVGALRNHSQHDRGEQRKQNRSLEVRKIHFRHGQSFRPVAIS